MHDATFAIQESLWSEHLGISPVLAIHMHTPDADDHGSSLATTQEEHSNLMALWHLNEDVWRGESTAPCILILASCHVLLCPHTKRPHYPLSRLSGPHRVPVLWRREKSLSLIRGPTTHCVGWVGPIYSSGILEKRKVSVTDWNKILNPGKPACNLSLRCLSYPGSSR